MASSLVIWEINSAEKYSCNFTSLMGISTVSIGLLPTYSTIGILAPILLVTLRLVQGIAVGGEWGGAVLLAVENARKKKRGFYGSFLQWGSSRYVTWNNCCFISKFTSRRTISIMGMENSFILSAILVITGLWIRRGIEETSVFSEEKQKAIL
ncbi:MFS transporter [Priestia megaterium]